MKPALPIRTATREALMTPETEIRSVEGFRRLASRHREALFRVAARLVDIGAAEDLVQETLTRGFAQRADFRGEADPFSWLCAILINRARREHRRRALRRWFSLNRAIEKGSEPIDGGARPDQRLVADERDALLRVAIDQLPQQQRLALVLVSLEGLSGRQAAEAMGVSEAAVWKALSRGRKKLRSVLDGRI